MSSSSSVADTGLPTFLPTAVFSATDLATWKLGESSSSSWPAKEGAALDRVLASTRWALTAQAVLPAPNPSE